MEALYCLHIFRFEGNNKAEKRYVALDYFIPQS